MNREKMAGCGTIMIIFGLITSLLLLMPNGYLKIGPMVIGIGLGIISCTILRGE